MGGNIFKLKLPVNNVTVKFPYKSKKDYCCTKYQDHIFAMFFDSGNRFFFTDGRILPRGSHICRGRFNCSLLIRQAYYLNLSWRISVKFMETFTKISRAAKSHFI